MGPGKISGVSDLSVSLLSRTELGSPHTCPVYAVVKLWKGLRQKINVTRTARKSDFKDKTKCKRNCFQSWEKQTKAKKIKIRPEAGKEINKKKCTYATPTPLVGPFSLIVFGPDLTCASCWAERMAVCPWAAGLRGIMTTFHRRIISLPSHSFIINLTLAQFHNYSAYRRAAITQANSAHSYTHRRYTHCPPHLQHAELPETNLMF